MSSARKIKARRKGRAQTVQADARRASGRTTRKQQQAQAAPRPSVYSRAHTPAPPLTAADLWEMLADIQDHKPVLTEIHLNTQDHMRMAAARGALTMPTYTLELARNTSRFMGVPVRDDPRIPRGGAVGVFSDGSAEYYAPEKP